jgi:hypothetical protein
MKGSVILRTDEQCKENCHFTIHPCNFKVKIKEIKPFFVFASKSLVLNVQVLKNCNVKSCIKIESEPVYGRLFLLDSSTIIYKSLIRCSAIDMFQMLVEDECGGKHVETVLINVIC